MNVLILGSFPPHETKRDYSFYYPNKQNHFWKILAAINKTELKNFAGDLAVSERKQLMTSLKTGVQNIAKIIERKGLSARDTDIVISEYQDILSIIKAHKELKRILIAGYSAESSTYKSFLKYLNSVNVKYTLPELVKPNASFTIFIDNRKIDCIITNSTSTATRIKIETLIDQFRKVIVLSPISS